MQKICKKKRKENCDTKVGQHNKIILPPHQKVSRYVQTIHAWRTKELFKF